MEIKEGFKYARISGNVVVLGNTGDYHPFKDSLILNPVLKLNEAGTVLEVKGEKIQSYLNFDKYDKYEDFKKDIGEREKESDLYEFKPNWLDKLFGLKAHTRVKHKWIRLKERLPYHAIFAGEFSIYYE